MTPRPVMPGHHYYQVGVTTHSLHQEFRSHYAGQFFSGTRGSRFP